MKLFSHPHILPVVALSFLSALGTVPARAQTARSIYLFNSSFGRGPGIIQDARSGPWGNGSATSSTRTSYEGAPSLQIMTRSFVEGVRFDMAKPVDPAAYMNNGFVRLRLKFRETGGGGGGAPFGGGGGAPFGGGAFGGGAFGGPPGNPGFRGQGEMVPHWNSAAQFAAPGGMLPGFGGLGGEGGVPTSPLPQSTFIKELKITFVRDQGVTTGRIRINLTSGDNRPDDNGWRLYTLAVKDMASTPGAAGAINRVVLTSDVPDTFYMAQMALVVETGQMTVSIRTPDKPAGAQVAEIEWRPERPLTLVADVEAGAADPQVEWNFDADNVGNLPAPAVNGGGTNPDGTPALGGAMGDPRGQLGIGGPIPGGAIPGGRLGVRGQLGIGGPGGMMQPGMMGDGGVGGQPAFVGPRIDARGLTTNFSYPNEEQNYRVEVTVRDRSGQKPPVKASILVRIRG